MVETADGGAGAVERLRTLCTALPEVTEQLSHGTTTTTGSRSGARRRPGHSRSSSPGGAPGSSRRAAPG